MRDFTGVYEPPPEPGEGASRWHIDPPRPPYLFVLATSVAWLVFVGALIIVGSQSQLTLGEVVGLALVGLAGAAALGLAYRKRPRLEVDEVRRELVWNPNTVLDESLTLPFSAVEDIRVRSSNPDTHHIAIDWRTNRGRTRMTRLPDSAVRVRMEAVVARLRESVGLPRVEVGQATPSTPA